MLQPNELRIGNYLQDQNGNLLIVDGLDTKSILTSVVDRTKYPLADGWQMEPIPLTPELLERCGFYQLPHFTIQNSWMKDLGRDRVLSVACLGTPNEMVFINEEQPPVVKNIIVAINYDYDGKTYLHQLQNLVFALTGQELKISEK